MTDAEQAVEPPAAPTLPRSFFVHTAQVITLARIAHELRRLQEEGERVPSRVVSGFSLATKMEVADGRRTAGLAVQQGDWLVPVETSPHVGRYSFRLEWDS